MQTAPTDPYSLTDPHWQKHLTIAGRAPRTLEELAIAKNDYAHRTRAAAIKAMREKLALLEAFARPLWDRGIMIRDRDIEPWTMDRKVLRIQSPLFNADDKLHAALIDLGFREIARKDWGRTDVVTLKHGRALMVAIEVSKCAAPAQPATPEATA